MKKIKILSMIILLTVSVLTIKAQTSVSGGIYSNTTWTKLNSPYIVIDDVVVFPSVILTIEPGVIVKFESQKKLEIRQGKLIAIGTMTDSITFTSNSANPTIGIWPGIYLNNSIQYLKFNYCNIKYAVDGIKLVQSSTDTLTVKNSIFYKNTNGITLSYKYGKMDSCSFISHTGKGINGGNNKVNNCNFSFNQIGVDFDCGNNFITNCIFNSNNIGLNKLEYTIVNNCIIGNNQYGIKRSQSCGFFGHSVIKNSTINSNSQCGLIIANGDSVINCQITNNKIGLTDSLGNGSNIIKNCDIENNIIGIKLWKSTELFTCNTICNNSSYDFYNKSTSNINMAYNYWCNNDSATIASHIYDGYDNISLGLVTFMPVEINPCFIPTESRSNEVNDISYSIFPNPAFDKLTLILPMNNLQSEIKIYNLIGQLKFISKIENTSSELNILKLTKGIYIIELSIDDKILRKKFIKQ